MPEVPSWVDDEMPFAGPCAFCTHPDRRHRILDAIAGRVEAGDSEEEVADDYDLPVAFVERVSREWDPEAGTP